MSSSREENLFKAKLAEDAERFTEMLDFMKEVVNAVDFSSDELTHEERTLLFTAYKNVTGKHRIALPLMFKIELKEHRAGNMEKEEKVRAYWFKIQAELESICEEVLVMIDEKLLCDRRKKVDAEAEVFYMKMKGDYNRYLAEFKDGSEKDVAADNTLSCYKAAQDVAQVELSATNPTRLGLALNFAVFYYEILSSPEQACTLAKQAFDDAIKEVDNLGEDMYKESTQVMQLIRDNIAMWASEIKDNGSKAVIKDVQKTEREQ